jgi:hypothetical protein
VKRPVIALAGQGVRSSVVRLPPTVHSLGRYGFISGLIAIARATGVAGYLGDGNDLGEEHDLAVEANETSAG